MRRLGAKRGEKRSAVEVEAGPPLAPPPLTPPPLPLPVAMEVAVADSAIRLGDGDGSGDGDGDGGSSSIVLALAPAPGARTRASWDNVPVLSADLPMSVLAAFEPGTRFVVWQGGCLCPGAPRQTRASPLGPRAAAARPPCPTTLPPHHRVAGTVLHLKPHDAIVWLGNLLHAGPEWPAERRTLHHRVHTHVQGRSPAPGWISGLDVCEEHDDGGTGFVAPRRISSRADSLAALHKLGAFETLHSAGFVVIPEAQLLSSDAQAEILQPRQSGWEAIANGGCVLREAWMGGGWREGFESAVADMLATHGLLATDRYGPCGGEPKVLVRTAALRSRPGCQQQPKHADFARRLAYG